MYYQGPLIEFVTSSYPVKITLRPLQHKTMSNPKDDYGTTFVGGVTISKVRDTVSVAFITA